MVSRVPFYRLVKQRYAGHAFDGFGARTYGGRWNSVGTSCVYLGSSRALCVLESLVHLTLNDLAADYVILTLQVPEKLIAELDSAALPPDWRHDPAPASTKAIGDGWLNQADQGLLLKVPSTLTGEWNAILNPQHPAAPEVIASVTVEPFSYDPRFSLR